VSAQRGRWIVAVALCLAAASGGAVAARAVLRRHPGAAPMPGAVTAVLGDSTPVTATREFAVFLGDVDCSACKVPGLPRRVQTILDSLRAVASSRKHTFASIGISMNGSPKAALDWLDRFGEFDEVLLGDQWLNVGVIKYIWTYPAAVPTVPQIMLFQHSITSSSNAIEVGNDSLVYRWLGVRDIAPEILRALRPGDSTGRQAPR
jgi:hypothetical protein